MLTIYAGLSTLAAPYFTIPLPDQQVDLNSNVLWICMADGVPTVTYGWYINATAFSAAQALMLPADKARFSVTGNRLSITNVQPQDAGMYQCSAENTHGMRLSSAQLRVLCECAAGGGVGA